MRRSVLALPLLAVLIAVSTVGAREEAAPVLKFKVDPNHSSVVFRVKHYGVTWVHGRFNEFDGAGTFSPDVHHCAIGFNVVAASVDTNQDKRDAHLRSKDFLDVEKFAAITFESTDFKRLGSSDQFEVTGKFTLHGVTKPVTAKVTFNGDMKDQRGTTRLGFDATFVVQRSLFGIAYGIPNIGDEIEVTVAVQATVSE